MKQMRFAATPLCLVLLFATNTFAQNPSVTWVQSPPENVAENQTISVAWEIKDLPGSFHAICTFCPESSGPHCKKGYPRQQTEAFSGSDHGHFSATFTFDSETAPGKFYAVAYGAYSPQSYYATEPVLIAYGASATHQTETEKNVSTSTTVEENSTSTVVVTPVAPAYGAWGWAEYNEAENTQEENQQAAEQQSEENQSQRQQAASDNQQQRQETASENQQQRQDAHSSQAQSGRSEGQNHTGSHREGGFQRGGEHEGGRGSFGGRGRR